MKSTIRQEIEELIRLVGIESWRGQIDLIACELPHDFDKAMTVLLKLDSKIPGLGQHNVNKKAADGHWTGVYRVEDRPIFRGIQYVGMHLDTGNPEWYTRMIVSESCYHIENSLKRKTGVRGRLSVGMILDQIGSKSLLDSDVYNALRILNRTVYNKAKHTIEDIDMDSHMFSIADAIAVYLVCRVLGARLLKGLGLTTADGNTSFP
jgi:hypothetical protein